MDLPEDLAFKIIQYFQGYSRKRQHIINNVRKENDYQFNIIMTSERRILKESGLQTDIKTIINLAEINKYFYNLIRKSDLGKTIWVAYYNSLFPLKINANSIHIGQKNWIKCGRYLGVFPGINNIRKPSENHCSNPIHYVNNEHKSGNNWKIDVIFKKIAIRHFTLIKTDAPDFTSFHENHLDSLKQKMISLQYEITKLEKRKFNSQLELDKIFEHWIGPKQVSSYKARTVNSFNIQ